MNVAQINYAFDTALADPDALLDRYTTLTGWSEALAAAGAARVTVVQRFSRDARITRNGIEYIFCHDGGAAGPRPWTWLRRFHHLVVDAEPDLVHVNGLIFPVQVQLLRRSLPQRTAVVVQDHASGAPDVRTASSVLSHAVRRRCWHAADGFLFAAAGQADAWRAAGLIASHQPVYHVMESSTTMRAVPRERARDASGVAGAPAVLWVGRLNANKDPLTVLNGFELSLARLPGAVLTMVYGAEDLLPAVREKLRASVKLQNHVRLVGCVAADRMPAFYSAADVFVLGSHHEGSGYALLEASACGVSPAVTNIPAFRAITADGSLGALWTAGDASSCACALVEVGLRDAVVERARIVEHFERALGWPAVGRQAMEAYRDAVARRRAARAGQATR